MPGGIDSSKWGFVKKGHLSVVFFVPTYKVVFVSWHAFKLQANVTRWLIFWSQTKDLTSIPVFGNMTTNQVRVICFNAYSNHLDLLCYKLACREEMSRQAQRVRKA